VTEGEDKPGPADPTTETSAKSPLSEAIDPREALLTSVVPREGNYLEDSVVSTTDGLPLDTTVSSLPARNVAPGETLQLVRFSKMGATLMISGLTPHGRRLTFEQREDRDGWYVVVGGRRRRPTERELGLVVASITQEMEAAMAPEGESEVRSAYRLAATSDQPGLEVRGLQAYRDLLLDEAAAYQGGQTKSLAVIAVEYQAFKRFAIRHGHRVGAAFVRALGERLQALYGGLKKIHVCHKAGKSFRLIVVDRSSSEIKQLLAKLNSDESRRWLVDRVWGRQTQRTHPDEVHFYIGFALARPTERRLGSYESLAQRLNDDAYRAARLGQLQGHTSITAAKTDYRTTIYQWLRSSDDELDDVSSQFDDGPAEVMAEMSDYLHELVPADLEGMAVDGDIFALVHRAIARDGFWQGTTAMYIAGETLIERFLARQDPPEGEQRFVGGFDLGDEFYGIAVEDDRFYFAWGDLNSAGATRLRAGLDRVQHAVGWRRADGGGVVGYFLQALDPEQSPAPLPQRVTEMADKAFAELDVDEANHINDAVDIADFLYTPRGELVKNEDLIEGASLTLVLPRRKHPVIVLERRSSFIVRLEIDGVEYAASVNDSMHGLAIKLRQRRAVLSAAVCMLTAKRDELEDMLTIVREDNLLPEDQPVDIVGFLRHIADILLADQVKGPGKIGLALGEPYRGRDFVKVYTLEEVREKHPGLYFESVHQNLIAEQAELGVDRQLRDLIATTMLARPRPKPVD
jgi:GGDEF domain-containing protein